MKFSQEKPLRIWKNAPEFLEFNEYV